MYFIMESNTDIENLFESAKTSDFLQIKEFTQAHHIDVGLIRNSENQTLLHVAAGYGRTNLASYLIAQGVDVNTQDSGGQAPLHNASCHGHYTISKKLIEAGADVDLVDSRGWSPLHFALARKDNVDEITPIYWKVINLLLNSDANPYLESTSGRSCFDRIKNKEDRRIIRLTHLLNELRKFYGDEETRVTLIDKYMRISDFFEFIKLGDDDLQVIETICTPNLINARLISCDNITPLHRAAGYNQLQVADLFIQKGAKVDAIDSFGRIPLHNAAQYGHVEMIELLVNERSDINKQDLIGYTPLHVAATNRTFTACLKLIELGADVGSKCLTGKIPYDLAESDDVLEVLKPDELRHELQLIPSSSSRAIYMDLRYSAIDNQRKTEPPHYSSLSDQLLLDSSSDERLFSNTTHSIKKISLEENDWRYIRIKQKMLETIMMHDSESGGLYSTYDIIGIELILNETVWSKYRLVCKKLEIEYGKGSKNEKLLFHGSNFIDTIQRKGFDERYARRNGMFGAGLYFAKHSSKSNQYTFGWGQGCREHMNKSCYICERKMIYAQVALGRSLVSKEALPDSPHAPPGYSSVTGSPESTDTLVYPEYVIYNGDQAYPLFVIKYKIVL